MELHPELASNELDNTWREILHVQRNTTLNLLTNDVISEESYERLTSQIHTAYVMNRPMNVFAVVGPHSGEKFKASVAANKVRLTPQEMAWLDLSSDSR